MKYVDGFVLVVKKDRIEDYREMAQKASQIWKKYGALEYFECVGDDLNPKILEGMEDMKGTTFPELTKINEDETVVFAFIVYKSREQRDEVNEKVMKDPEMSPEAWEGKEMPFDMKKVSFGGFKVLVEERR